MKVKAVFKGIFLLGFLVTLISCAQNKQLYYYGDYSDTLYACKKNPCSESTAAHKEVLEKIIVESEKRNLRVPPGIFAELGYIYGEENNAKKAIELFKLEKQTYPESTILMDRLILQAEKRNPGINSQETIPTDEIKTEKTIGESKDD
jgi:hypothetical protein